MTDETRNTERLEEYRKWLVAAEQKSQEDFDKTVLSLSGGALGISFVFLKDVIGPQSIVLPWFLLAAWLTWAFSTFSVLTSYYLSHLALRRAISQVDKETIYQQPPGGDFARWTAILNATGAILFLIGVCSITVFAGTNLSSKGAINEQKKASITETITKSTSETANPNAGPPSSSDDRLHSTTTTPSKRQEIGTAR